MASKNNFLKLENLNFELSQLNSNYNSTSNSLEIPEGGRILEKKKNTKKQQNRYADEGDIDEIPMLQQIDSPKELPSSKYLSDRNPQREFQKPSKNENPQNKEEEENDTRANIINIEENNKERKSSEEWGGLGEAEKKEIEARISKRVDAMLLESQLKHNLQKTSSPLSSSSPVTFRSDYASSTKQQDKPDFQTSDSTARDLHYTIKSCQNENKQLQQLIEQRLAQKASEYSQALKNKEKQKQQEEEEEQEKKEHISSSAQLLASNKYTSSNHKYEEFLKQDIQLLKLKLQSFNLKPQTLSTFDASREFYDLSSNFNMQSQCVERSAGLMGAGINSSREGVRGEDALGRDSNSLIAKSMNSLSQIDEDKAKCLNILTSPKNSYQPEADFIHQKYKKRFSEKKYENLSDFGNNEPPTSRFLLTARSDTENPINTVKRIEFPSIREERKTDDQIIEIEDLKKRTREIEAKLKKEEREQSNFNVENIIVGSKSYLIQNKPNITNNQSLISRKYKSSEQDNREYFEKLKLIQDLKNSITTENIKKAHNLKLLQNLKNNQRDNESYPQYSSKNYKTEQDYGVKHGVNFHEIKENYKGIHYSVSEDAKLRMNKYNTVSSIAPPPPENELSFGENRNKDADSQKLTTSINAPGSVSVSRADKIMQKYKNKIPQPDKKRPFEIHAQMLERMIQQREKEKRQKRSPSFRLLKQGQTQKKTQQLNELLRNNSSPELISSPSFHPFKLKQDSQLHLIQNISSPSLQNTKNNQQSQLKSVKKANSEKTIEKSAKKEQKSIKYKNTHK